MQEAADVMVKANKQADDTKAAELLVAVAAACETEGRALEASQLINGQCHLHHRN